MKTVRRLVYAEILNAVLYVALGFLSLFFFFDLVDELPAIGRDGPLGYQLTHALLYVCLLVPSHLYELLPIAVLIGCVFVMARLAQSSEYTILRTSGLGPWLALKTLLKLGLVFVALTFLIGDYLAPPADRAAQLLKARFQGRISVGQTGAWLKERQKASSASVNVRAILPDGSLSGVRIFEFNDEGYFHALIEAEKGQFVPGAWALVDVQRTQFNKGGGDSASMTRTAMPEHRWPTELTSEMVSAAVLNPSRMRIVDLFVYMRHLEANRQSAQRYQIEFWRKVFYPLSCHGGSRPALCLSAFPRGWHRGLCVWWGDGGYQFFPAQQRVQFHRQSAELAPLADGSLAESDLFRDFAGGLWLAGPSKVTQSMSPATLLPVTAIVLFGHGSRDPLWRQPMDAVASRIREIDPQARVVCAFLELTKPDLLEAVDTVVADGATLVTVLPMFLGVGRHAREDLPVLLADLRQRHQGVEFVLQPAVGEDRRLTDLLAHMALG